MNSFRIPNEELKPLIPAFEYKGKKGFRIPNEELKRDFPTSSSNSFPCFRIPNEELKLGMEKKKRLK